MPLSSVVGAQSIVKPGVCTSTTKPASPFDGQMIYMTDVDQSAVWDGSAWVGLDPSRDRNVVINGAMQIAQRGTSTAGVTTGTTYNTADRWRVMNNALGVWTQSIENDAPTGSGFRKSLKMLCTTADASPSSTDYCIVNQSLEGQNIQQFAKGTASAKQFALSFWVKSNVTGTYIAQIWDTDNSRSVSASYTISASATWEKKTIIFPADTSGAWNNDNGESVQMRWWLASGSAFTSGTLGTTWAAGVDADAAVGQTNLASATNNYWQVTGVQLEAGAVATPFEFEDYGTTLKKCERYFKVLNPPLSRGTFTTATSVGRAGSSIGGTMRVAPTVSWSGTMFLYDGANVGTATSPSGWYTTTNDIEWEGNTATGTFVQYRVCMVYANAGSGTASLSAEL